MNLYGRGGFDKSQLRRVESDGGLRPKGYIPVMAIGDEVIRESSTCVERVAALSATAPGAVSLEPEDPQLARELIRLCDTLPKAPQSAALDQLLRKADAVLAARGEAGYLAGSAFSVADACLLPFLQRVDLPADAAALRGYLTRAHAMPAFSRTVVDSWWWWW